MQDTKDLSDGTAEKIITRNPRNESGSFSYNCHLCGVASLHGENSLNRHIKGKRHQKNLGDENTPDAYQFRAPLPAIRKRLQVSRPETSHEDEEIPMSLKSINFEANKR